MARAEVLIVGWSMLAQRRLVPALGTVDVASRRGEEAIDQSARPHVSAIFEGYAQALQMSDCPVVYISLPNALHAQWVEAALREGRDVIVDKPAFPDVATAERLADLAVEKGRLLVEATVFDRHAQMRRLMQLADEDEGYRIISAEFLIPAPAADNFRSQSGLGGGALLDMGPYAAATARLLGRGPVRGVSVASLPTKVNGDVDGGFQVELQFDKARLRGLFAFGMSYQNTLTVWTERQSLQVERVFSPPPDVALNMARRLECLK